MAEGNIKDGVTIFGVLGTFIGDVPDWYATETLQNSNDSTRTYTGTSYQKKKETRLNEAFTGSIRIKFSLNTSAGAGGNGRLYRNGVALGLERTVPFSWTVFSEDFTGLEWESGDLIQVYLKSYIGDSSIQTQDLQLCYNAEADPVSTTNQDP